LNLLAFDTSTDILSVAVQAGDPRTQPVLQVTEQGGAKASATLLPLIRQLLSQAGLALKDLDAIVFGRGPGSFTGLRTACAVAQGLGFGSAVPVLAVDTLLAVAEEAHAQSAVERVVAVLDARMAEVYWAAYQKHGATWREHEPARLGPPDDVRVAPGWSLAGNALALYSDRLAPAQRRISALPTASALLRLAPALMAAGQAGPAADAMPLYIRDKVAQTTQERHAIKAASHPTP